MPRFLATVKLQFPAQGVKLSNYSFRFLVAQLAPTTARAKTAPSFTIFIAACCHSVRLFEVCQQVNRLSKAKFA